MKTNFRQAFRQSLFQPYWNLIDLIFLGMAVYFGNIFTLIMILHLVFLSDYLKKKFGK